jgi:hypothetical protein
MYVSELSVGPTRTEKVSVIVTAVCVLAAFRAWPLFCMTSREMVPTYRKGTKPAGHTGKTPSLECGEDRETEKRSIKRVCVLSGSPGALLTERSRDSRYHRRPC